MWNKHDLGCTVLTANTGGCTSKKSSKAFIIITLPDYVLKKIWRH